ncbi:MAG: BACON domain-containing protein, partial [Prevotella sp.]|nr:BACON domain-containing protein [Prevotella sp.]
TYGATLLVSILTLSCSGGGESVGGGTTTNDYIRIDQNVSSITLNPTEKQRLVSVYSNCSWQVTISTSNWPTLKLDRNSGSNNVEIWLETDENTSTSARTATLTFQSPGISKTLTVTQTAGESFLRVSADSYEFGGDGGEQTFTIESNVDWQVSNNVQEWCKLDKKEGKSGTTQLTVTVDENPNTTPRETQIIVTGGKTATISISQKGKDYSLTLGTDNVVVDALGGEETAKTFTVTCNGSWNTSIRHEDGGAWCSISPTYGSATGANPINIKVVCQPNYTTSTRNAIITVVAGNNAKEAEVKVVQQAATYPVFAGLPTCKEISNTKQEVTISFTSMFEVTEYGFCLGTSPNPTKRYPVEGGRGKSATIQMQLDVEEGMTYYVRAYAVSPVGEKINYSEEATFETKGKHPGKDDNLSQDV